MLLADDARGDGLAVTVYDGRAEHSFSLEDTLRVMSQRAMPEIADELL